MKSEDPISSWLVFHVSVSDIQGPHGLNISRQVVVIHCIQEKAPYNNLGKARSKKREPFYSS